MSSLLVWAQVAGNQQHAWKTKVIPLVRNGGERGSSTKEVTVSYSLCRMGHCQSKWSNVGATIHDGRKQALAKESKVSDRASSQVTREIVKGLGDVLCTKQKLRDLMVVSRCLEENTPGRLKNFLILEGLSYEGVNGLFVEVIKKRQTSTH